MLHQPTLVAGQVILTVIYAVIFYFIHWVYPKLDGVLYAVAGFAVASVARIFYMGSGGSVMLAADILALTASGLLYLATLRHLRIPKSNRQIWTVVGSCITVVLLFRVLHLRTPIHMIFDSAAFVLIRFLWARDLFRRAHGKPILLAFAIYMAIYAVFAMNILSVLLPGMAETSSRNLQMPASIMISVGNVALSVLLGLFMLLMIADTIRSSEKLAAAGLLASAIAHEINNPLQSVTNLLFILQHDNQQNHSSILLKEAQDELDRVNHVVTQALRFHQQSENIVPVKLGELMDSVLRVFRLRMEHAGVLIKVEDNQSDLLSCYQEDLRQVFSNLIGNALDAVGGRSNARITVRICDALDLRSGQKGIRITFADNGAGMDRATQKRIFEPFYSTKGARATGLGLWVSREILEKHQAQLQLRSSQHVFWHGTVFRIFFPLSGGRPHHSKTNSRLG